MAVTTVRPRQQKPGTGKGATGARNGTARTRAAPGTRAAAPVAGIEPTGRAEWNAYAGRSRALAVALSKDGLALFDVLTHDSQSITFLANRLGIAQPKLEGFCRQLKAMGLIKGNPSQYSLTDLGEQVWGGAAAMAAVTI